MILKTLTIQNFLSIRNIKLDLDNQGLVLIKGKNLDNEAIDNNGSGKSSMIEALVYALYGRTIRGLTGDAVVHNIPKKNMKIWLDLIDDNGDEYRIARYRKHSTNKNKSFLYKNGKDITPKSERDFNSSIVDLLQMDYLTFTSSLLYTAESFKFTSATDSEIKSTFDKMLGLDVFSKCLEITKNRIKEVEGELSTTQWKITDRKSKLDSLATNISEAEEASSGYEQKQKEKEESLNDDLSELKEELTDLESDLELLEDAYEKAQGNSDRANKALKRAESNLKELNQLKEVLQDTKDELSDVKRSIRGCNDTIESLENKIEISNKKISRCGDKIKKLTQSKSKLDEQVGQPCPTCGQPMTEESIQPAKNEYDEQISEQQEELDKYTQLIEANNKSIKEQQSKLGELTKKSEELQGDIDDFEELISKSQKLIDDKEEAEAQVKKCDKAVYKAEYDIKAKKTEIKHAKESIESKEEAIQQLAEEENPYDAIIEGYLKEQKDCQEQIEELTESISEKSDEKDCLLFWQQAYSNQGIKSFILDDITPFLNRRVNKYLSKLAAGHIEVKFSTQTTLKSGEVREKFSIDINNQDGGSVYAANSAGEKKRVDLAVNLALQDLVAARSNKSLNLAIFDEIFDSLDESGIESVISLLQELATEKSSIFVISHNPHLQAMFSNVITVVKKDGYSTLLGKEDTPEE